MSPDSVDPSAALQVALAAAQAGAQIIRDGAARRAHLNIVSKSPRDFVSEVDRDAERVILDVLRARYPDHAVLAEESGNHAGAKTSPWQWIIDPLDGTTNFLHGVPVYAVSIALAFAGHPRVAVVLDVPSGETFSATAGGGAFLNGERLRVSSCNALDTSLIGTGFAFRPGDDFERYVRLFKNVAQHTSGLRRPGAASVDLAWLAAGRYDGFFEIGLAPWDMAAGMLLIEEAGGRVTDFAGADLVRDGRLHPSPFLASNGLLHEALRALLNP
jgi:myo-inositol-1(or 4)-monophosphatase